MNIYTYKGVPRLTNYDRIVPARHLTLPRRRGFSTMLRGLIARLCGAGSKFHLHYEAIAERVTNPNK